MTKKRHMRLGLWGLFLVYLLPSLRTIYAQEQKLLELNKVVLECLSTTKPQPCEDALLRADSLQRIAGNHSKYSCQTFTLGLASDLILIRQKAKNRKQVLSTLRDVNQFCLGL